MHKAMSTCKDDFVSMSPHTHEALGPILDHLKGQIDKPSVWEWTRYQEAVQDAVCQENSTNDVDLTGAVLEGQREPLL